jgi:hypothetical protein
LLVASDLTRGREVALLKFEPAADRNTMTTEQIRIPHLDQPEPACYLPTEVVEDRAVATVTYGLRGEDSQTYCPWFSVIFYGDEVRLLISDFGLN